MPSEVLLPKMIYGDESDDWWATERWLGYIEAKVRTLKNQDFVTILSKLVKDMKCGEEIDALSVKIDGGGEVTVECDGADEQQIETLHTLFLDAWHSSCRQTVEDVVFRFRHGITSANVEDVVKHVFGDELYAERKSTLEKRALEKRHGAKHANRNDIAP